MTNNYKLYHRRWFILAVFSLTSMINEEIWISLSTITSIVQRYYQINPFWINWLSVIYILSMVLFLIPCSYLVNRFGLRWTMIIGGFLNALGSCLRLIGSGRNGFFYIFVGSTICSLGQCCLFFLPPHIAAVWFADSERTIASAIGILTSFGGIAVGFLLGTFVVSKKRSNESEIGHGIWNLLMFEVLASTFLFLLCVFVVKDAPPTPPSRSQELRLNGFVYIDDKEEIYPGKEIEQVKLEGSTHECESETDESQIYNHLDDNIYSFMDSLMTLFQDKQFSLLCQAFAIYTASNFAYITILNQTTVYAFPGKEKEVGYMGIAAVLSGLLSMFLCGVILTKTKEFKLLSVLIFVLAFISTLLLTIVLHIVRSMELTFLLYILYGLFSYPFISTGLEYVAEVTFPVPEIISSSICLVLANLYAVVLTQILGILLQNGINVGGYIVSGAYGLSFLLVFIVKAPLKRSAIDNNIEIN